MIECIEYKEIFRLKEMLEKANIPFVFKEHKDFRRGFQILYPADDGKSVCSVIEHDFSYGHNVDMLEIMGLLTTQEQKRDSVIGYLSAEDVFARIKKHYEKKY